MIPRDCFLLWDLGFMCYLHEQNWLIILIILACSTEYIAHLLKSRGENEQSSLSNRSEVRVRAFLSLIVRTTD